jgi:hypothetical protein
LPKAKPSPRSAGIATWHALAMDFDILRRQIGDKWKRWKPEDIDFVRQKIAPILAFNVQLLSLRRRTRA